jgi:hypothetical protein
MDPSRWQETNSVENNLTIASLDIRFTGMSSIISPQLKSQVAERFRIDPKVQAFVYGYDLFKEVSGSTTSST